MQEEIQPAVEDIDYLLHFGFGCYAFLYPLFDVADEFVLFY